MKLPIKMLAEQKLMLEDKLNSQVKYMSQQPQKLLSSLEFVVLINLTQKLLEFLDYSDSDNSIMESLLKSTRQQLTC